MTNRCGWSKKEDWLYAGFTFVSGWGRDDNYLKRENYALYSFSHNLYFLPICEQFLSSNPVSEAPLSRSHHLIVYSRWRPTTLHWRIPHAYSQWHPAFGQGRGLREYVIRVFIDFYSHIRSNASAWIEWILFNVKATTHLLLVQALSWVWKSLASLNRLAKMVCRCQIQYICVRHAYKSNHYSDQVQAWWCCFRFDGWWRLCRGKLKDLYTMREHTAEWFIVSMLCWMKPSHCINPMLSLLSKLLLFPKLGSLPIKLSFLWPVSKRVKTFWFMLVLPAWALLRFNWQRMLERKYPTVNDILEPSIDNHHPFYSKRIFITAGSDEKVAFCENLGATKGINYKKQDWAEEVKLMEYVQDGYTIDWGLYKGCQGDIQPRCRRDHRFRWQGLLWKEYRHIGCWWSHGPFGVPFRYILYPPTHPSLVIITHPIYHIVGPVIEKVNIGPMLRKRLRVSWWLWICKHAWDWLTFSHLCRLKALHFAVDRSNTKAVCVMLLPNMWLMSTLQRVPTTTSCSSKKNLTGRISLTHIFWWKATRPWARLS